jgi:predicted dehydrogenase
VQGQQAPADSQGDVRVAVQGCGYWGSKHVRVLQSLETVDHVVAVDPDPERLKAIEATYSEVQTATDIEAVLGEVDAVIIATAPETHFELATYALGAGKHVLVEKPMATTVKDASAMVDLAIERGLALGVGHTFEFNTAVWALRDLMLEGELGRPLYIDSARLNLGLYQSRTNAIWDLAPHDVSITNFLLGDTPTRVRAWGLTCLHRRLEDVGYLWLEYERQNVHAHIHVSWLDPCKVRRVTVVGDQKMAVYNDLSNDEPVRIYDKGLHPIPELETPDMPHTYRVGSIVSPHVPFGEPLREMDAQFVAAAASGGQPMVDGFNGLAVVRILEAAERSLREERVVTIDDEISDRRSA